MSREDMKLLEQISRILLREKLLSPEEQLRMLSLIRKEGQSS